MRVRLCGLELRNPVIAASGTFGYGIEFEEILSLDKIGGFVTKGLSREPMAGNDAPRIIETASGMINAIGLQNMGVAAFIEEKLPRFAATSGTACIANVFGYTVDDYLAVIEQLNDAEGIAAYELNASCPNTRHGGLIFGADPTQLAELVVRAKEACPAPADRQALAQRHLHRADGAHLEAAGADAISLVNTFVSLSIDVKTRRPRIANVTGGLSGPPSSRSLCGWCGRPRGRSGFPSSAWAASHTGRCVEFLLAGATAVQVGTASYADPRAVERLAQRAGACGAAEPCGAGERFDRAASAELPQNAELDR